MKREQRVFVESSRLGRTSGLTSVAFERARIVPAPAAETDSRACASYVLNSPGPFGGANVGGGYPANPDIKVTYYQNDMTGFRGGDYFVHGRRSGVIYRSAMTAVTNTNHKITHPAVPLANTCYHISLAYRSDVNDSMRHLHPSVDPRSARRRTRTW